jgi:hypothetical protein
MIGMTTGRPAARESAGLKDGGETVLSCSNCGRGLACIRNIKPDAVHRDGTPFLWLVRATCAYGCKKANGEPETSFISEVRGLIAHDGYGLESEDPERPEDRRMLTAVADIRQDRDAQGRVVQTFITRAK